MDGVSKSHRDRAVKTPARAGVVLAASPLLLALVIAMWRMGAAPFALFAVPILLSGWAVSIWMAIVWREWRALPLSAVLAVIVLRLGLDTSLRAGRLPGSPTLDLASDVLLWFSVPLAFAAVAGLWRIFENQARFEQAQRDLFENEKRYRHLVENATDAFYAANARGVLTLVNTGAGTGASDGSRKTCGPAARDGRSRGSRPCCAISRNGGRRRRRFGNARDDHLPGRSRGGDTGTPGQADRDSGSGPLRSGRAGFASARRPLTAGRP